MNESPTILEVRFVTRVLLGLLTLDRATLSQYESVEISDLSGRALDVGGPVNPEDMEARAIQEDHEGHRYEEVLAHFHSVDGRPGEQDGPKRIHEPQALRSWIRACPCQSGAYHARCESHQKQYGLLCTRPSLGSLHRE